jgi:hypothetical protein
VGREALTVPAAVVHAARLLPAVSMPAHSTIHAAISA